MSRDVTTIHSLFQDDDDLLLANIHQSTPRVTKKDDVMEAAMDVADQDVAQQDSDIIMEVRKLEMGMIHSLVYDDDDNYCYSYY